MHDEMPNVHWSPRIPLLKIRRLYERDAQGVPDEELLDDVGQGLFFRCRDMLGIYEARRGRVACRNCGNLIRRRWHISARHLENSKTELQAIARELGVKGCSGMRKEQLIAAIERVDPARFKAWTCEHDSTD